MPGDAVVIEVERTSHSQQFPSLTPVLYPGELMTAIKPFASVSAMWQAHQMYATNNTPTINGEKYYYFTSTGGNPTFSSSPSSSHLLSRRVRAIVRPNRARNATPTSRMSLRHNLCRTLTLSRLITITDTLMRSTWCRPRSRPPPPPFGVPVSLRLRELRPSILTVDSASIAVDVTTV